MPPAWPVPPHSLGSVHQKLSLFDGSGQPSAISCQQNTRETEDWPNAESSIQKSPIY
jgi:hypothetical protein